MPQLSSNLSSVDESSSIQGKLASDSLKESQPEPNQAELMGANPQIKASFGEQSPPLASVMSELNRLSKSFVDSYQNLEGQVEKLNGQLQNEAEEKQHALQDKIRLQNEKSLLADRLQSLLSVMPAGVVVIDGQGRVKDCNAKAVEILGRPLLGELWITVINRAFKPQADDGHQVSLKDGRKIHIETRGLDAEPGQLVVLTDLTKTRRLQADLSQQQKLSSMGKMIASLAHQIRTPLSAAILYGSHLTQNNLDENLKQKFSGHLLERLHFMERQINDMLQFMRGERKQKQLIGVGELFQKISARKAEFELPVEFQLDRTINSQIMIHADMDALLGALTNLIENACNACRSVEPARILVNFRGNKTLNISVQDNGTGIDAADLKQIFEPFYTTRHAGNGLGLAIVHGIVIDHKGSISVDSDKRQGSCFTIELPLTIRPQKAAGSEPMFEEIN